MRVRAINQSDVAPLGQLLAEAFCNDPGLRWVIPESRDWERIATPWFRWQLADAFRLGNAFTDASRRGVAIWSRLDARTSLLRQFVRNTQLVGLFRHNLPRAMQMQRVVGATRPRRPAWYLAYLAAHPDYQGQGIGRQLLEPMLALADRHNMPVYLECSNRENLSFYFQQGFNLVETLQLPDGPGIWPMRREPA